MHDSYINHVDCVNSETIIHSCDVCNGKSEE